MVHLRLLLCVGFLSVAGPSRLLAQSDAAPDTSSLAPSDSLSGSTADTLARAEAESLGVSEAPPPVIRSLPRSMATRLGVEALLERRSETLDDVLRATPGLSLRVDGDRGMRAFLDTSPVDPGWVEIFVDGVPSQNPSDDESALWDLPVAGLVGLQSSAQAWWQTGGEASLAFQTEGGIEGRTRMRTHFSSTARESFYRAVTLRTPDADRVLRLDFGEWKTDLGTPFSFSSNVVGAPDAGRSKMRRFVLGADLQTDLGRLSLRFGRGTRFFRGSVSRPDPVERWSGRLSLGLHRESPSRISDLRLFHLDWHIDDRGHGEFRDASRRGLRWQSRPADGRGWFLDFGVEEQAARFETAGDTIHAVNGVMKARIAPGWRVGSQRGPAFLIAADFSHAENSRRDVDVGGRWEGQVPVGERSQIRAGFRRVLRSPSLLESDGWSTWDTVIPVSGGYLPTVTAWRRESGARLFSERQDLAFLRGEGIWWNWRWSLGAESWRLRDGIGWETLPDGSAPFVGDLGLDRQQIVGTLQTRRHWNRQEFSFSASGHRVVSSLRRSGSRGGGWPLYSARADLGLSRPFFSQHNRLGMDLVGQVLGPRFDDRHVVLGASDSDPLYVLDLRVWLKIRDAELRISYDNLLDARLEEVLGTFRRGRQMRLSLRWDYFN